MKPKDYFKEEWKDVFEIDSSSLSGLVWKVDGNNREIGRPVGCYVTRTDGLEMNVYWEEVEHYDKFISHRQKKNKSSTVEATAWKLGDIEFIREGYNVNIFGAGEIQIPISTLKTILETLETN